jgi:hypothetical protein
MRVLRFGARFDALTDLTNRACAALADALMEGACPHLTVLSLARTGLGLLGAQHLAYAIRIRALPRLERLDVSGNGIGFEGLRALAAALGTGGAPELWQANLTQLVAILAPACFSRSSRAALGSARGASAFRCSRPLGVRLEKPCLSVVPVKGR